MLSSLTDRRFDSKRAEVRALGGFKLPEQTLPKFGSEFTPHRRARQHVYAKRISS
jgi:hypothetical protein